MAVADLSLALSVQSSGTAEIDKLISALNKYSDKIDQIRNQKPPEAAPWERGAGRLRYERRNMKGV